MDFTMSRKLILFILLILSSTVYIFNNSSDDKNKKNNITNSNIMEMIKTNVEQTSKNVQQISQKSSSKLQKKILIEKQKIQDAKVLHENILHTRKEYLLRESQKRSKYLSHKARYKDLATRSVEQKFKSIKTDKEKVHRQRHEQYTAGKRFERHAQVHKRTELDKARLKGLTNIQKKQLMYQKYKQGE